MDMEEWFITKHGDFTNFLQKKPGVSRVEMVWSLY